VNIALRLRPRRQYPHTPNITLPPQFGHARVSQIYIHDERPTHRTSFWTHLTLNRYPDTYRLAVTTELLPCTPYQQNTSRRRWTDRPPEDFSEYVDRVRFTSSPRLLADLSDVVDAALLGRSRAYQVVPVRPTYEDTGFHFLPTQLDTDTSTIAYREFPANFGIRDPITLVNQVATHPLGLERMTVTFTLSEA
jgi:hypothetical protein